MRRRPHKRALLISLPLALLITLTYYLLWAELGCRTLQPDFSNSLCLSSLLGDSHYWRLQIDSGDVLKMLASAATIWVLLYLGLAQLMSAGRDRPAT